MFTGSEFTRFPVRVVAGDGARVLDVIGLTCFLYTRDNIATPLQSVLWRGYSGVFVVVAAASTVAWI